MINRLLTVLAVSALVAVGSARAADPADSKLIGDYGVDLVVGPAEKSAPKGDMAMMASSPSPASSSGTGAQPKDEGMVHVAGAKLIEPADLGDYRHLVVFVYSKDVDVKDAKVKIAYAPVGSSKMIELPVATMYSAAGGVQTTHYGNNVKLKPGDYKVAVTVNGNTGDFKVNVN